MSALNKDFFKGFFTGLILLVLLLSNPAFAYSLEQASYNTASFADENPLLLGNNDTSTGNTNNNQNITNVGNTNNIDFNIPTSTVAPGTCSVSKLSPTESKAIMDLTHEGFNGKQISDGKDVNNGNPKNLGDVELIGKDIDGKEAIKVSAPSVAAKADRFSFLNGTTISGPFGIGLILDDTMRIGRCQGLRQDQCLINGEGLSVRTSGVGFKSDMVNAFSSATNTGTSLAESALSKDDANKLKSNYLDINSNDFITGAFAKGEMLRNSILTSQYTAKNATTCNNSACTISTYSAFDKYFNSWMTTTMVVSTFGPTLLNKAQKLMTQAYKSTAGDILKSKWAIPQKLRDKVTGLTSPMSMFGKARDMRFKALMHEEGLGKVIEEPLVISKALWSSGAKGEITKLTDPSSPLWKLSADKREKAFEAIEHLSAYARASSEGLVDAQSAYKAAAAAADQLPDAAMRETAKKAAKMEFAQKAANDLDAWDEVLALDFEDWAKANDDLFSFGGYAVKKNGSWANDTGYVDISTGQPFNFKRVVQTFGKDGDWSKWANSADAETFSVAADGVSLQLYKIQPKQVIAENVGLTDLHNHLSKMGASTYAIKFPDGTYRALNENSIKYIESNPLLPGHVSIYESGYAPAEAMTPDDFANRITDTRIIGRPKTAVRNLDDLKNALVQNNFAPRKYTSLLDQQFAAEGDMIKAYYKNPVTGIYKGTVLPIAYWNFKKGLGNEDFSAYMLPDTWSTLTVSQGVDKIYGDSYIDFFVNEGSDQGDMFKRAFNSLPLVWNKIIEMAAGTNQFVKDGISKVSGGFFEGAGSMRDTVGEVAFYSHNENCSGCVAPLKYMNEYLILNGFNSRVNMQAFLIEANSAETKQKTGTTLISYTHHSDLQGKTGQIEGEQINITDAASNDLTCEQKLEKYHLGWAGTSAGAVTMGIESLAYIAGFGPGLIASFTLQMTVGRDLQDCIDDKEGYYIHFFAPAEKEATKTKSKESLSNETVTNALSDMSNKLNDFVKTKQDEVQTQAEKVNADIHNPVEKSMDEIKNQFNEFKDKATQANILQASVELMAPSSGTLMGKDIFYVWFKDSLMPAAYRTTGKSVTTDGNNTVEKNYADGTLKINGKTVLDTDKADHTRMIAQDNRIPAEVVPVTLNRVAAPMNDQIVFEMNSYGEIKVLNSEVLDCIQKAVKDQTGIEYSGDELTQVFGSLKQLGTENYGSIFARDGKIFLEGTAPRAQGESYSKLTINGFWKTKLTIDSNNGVDAGKFTGMTFEHGSIVLKPETNELVIWLRQHKDSVLSNKDVKGLLAHPTTVKDPENECPVPAIDLEAIPFPNDELAAKKVDNFNTSMEHLGPFTQFTTDKKIYEFYSKRDANTGECKDYFRVRDKDTGKILEDKEIVGGIKQDADGTIRFKTADGQEHTLDFSAENGVPKVSYNGGPQETLLSAQGPNGSFWYDPEKGLWYPENGLQIPLNQGFKDNGAYFGSDENGNVTGTGTNPMTFNIGQGQGSGFSLPSMPETISGLILFITLFLLLAYTLTYGRTLKAKRKH